MLGLHSSLRLVLGLYFIVWHFCFKKYIFSHGQDLKTYLVAFQSLKRCFFNLKMQGTGSKAYRNGLLSEKHLNNL